MEISSLCAKIPVELHHKVRKNQQESGLSLGDYMAELLDEYFKMTEVKKMNEKTRTVAIQLSDNDFYRLKAHVKRTGEKQKDFMYRVIFDIIAMAESEISQDELQDQLLEAEISGEKKTRTRNGISSGQPEYNVDNNNYQEQFASQQENFNENELTEQENVSTEEQNEYFEENNVAQNF